MRVLAGEKPKPRRTVGSDAQGEVGEDESDDADQAGFSDRTMAFYGIVLASVFVVYTLTDWATGRYFSEYNTWAFALTELRSDVPEVRARGLENLHQPVRGRVREAPGVHQAVVELLDDDSPLVRDWAIWSAGRLRLQSASDGLIAFLEHPEHRVEAAHALGRIQDSLGVARMKSHLPGSVRDPEWSAALFRGLGLARTREHIDVSLPLLDLLSPEALPVAWWAMTRTWPHTLQSEVRQRWEGAEEHGLRCILAEAWKYTVTEEDAGELRSRVVDTPGEPLCEEIAWTDRPWDGGERAERLVFVIEESLQVKMLKAAFNAGGPGLQRWLQEVAMDPGYADATRILAHRFAEELTRVRLSQGR